ncbi:MAG TPA: 3-deoxy-7-phosphoheptulonate synthase [Steroidobacteraceae bacterium]|nr:3-deoxy-7-phosphoheptulonate synthase [Steroidobacteraceae bacterium]
MASIQDQLQNVNVVSSDLLATPEEVKRRLPLTTKAADTVFKSREAVRAILERRDPRLFVVVGPCSIHDVAAAREYAGRLKELAGRVGSTLLLIMRVYFEKPRTTVGWKGLINDPDLDDSFHIEKGILLARELLLYVAELGLPAGTEALDPIMPQYLSELITWTAIGARTTESQTHREMASGLSTPVGFKNGTDGALAASINALRSVRHPHHFLGITQTGQSAVFRTKGNQHAHIVLRGGGGRVNYDAVSIAVAERELKAAELPATIVVDCSHGNSNKDADLQPLVAENCVTQIVDGNRSIVGLMLESHLKAGSQAIPKDLSKLEYGMSITDPCIDWATTESLLLKLHESLRRVPNRAAQ